MVMSSSHKATDSLYWCWFGGVHGIGVAQALGSCVVQRHSSASTDIVKLIGQTKGINRWQAHDGCIWQAVLLAAMAVVQPQINTWVGT